MKKLSILLGAIVFAGCAHADTVDVLGASCDQIASGERGDILVRCPANDALREIQAGAPDSMFLSIQLDEAIKDKQANDGDYIYVNILSDELSSCAPGVSEYRVLIVDIPADMPSMYSFSKCAE